MKKLIALLLVAVMCVSFVACGGSGSNETPSSGENTENNDGTTNQLDGTTNQLDEATLQAKYDHAVNELSRYMSVEFAWTDSGELLHSNEAALYLYNEFKALGNYKDSADYFNRFLVLDNALTKITEKEGPDAFGNTNERDYANYWYSSYGECPKLSKLFELIGLINTGEDSYKYEYADDGKITTIHTFEYGEQVLRASLVYDKKGNIIEVNYLTKNNASYSNKYTYNEDNKLISADKNIMSSLRSPEGYWDSHVFVEYAYDAHGRISVVKTNSKEITYSYDSNSNISEEHITYIYDGGSATATELKVYAYNENGSISSVKVTINKNTSYTLIYHYETLYIYQSHK